jgi:hypothetical protein
MIQYRLVSVMLTCSFPKKSRQTGHHQLKKSSLQHSTGNLVFGRYFEARTSVVSPATVLITASIRTFIYYISASYVDRGDNGCKDALVR